MTDRQLYLKRISLLEAQRDALFRIIEQMLSTPHQTPKTGRGKQPFIIRHSKDQGFPKGFRVINQTNDQRKNSTTGKATGGS